MASEKCIGERRPVPSPQIHGAVSSAAVSEQASKQTKWSRPSPADGKRFMFLFFQKIFQMMNILVQDWIYFTAYMLYE